MDVPAGRKPERYAACRRKVDRMSLKKIQYSVVILLLIGAVVAASGCAAAAGGEDAKGAINKTLVGQNITYFSIAGKPLNYTITQDDIGSIDPTTYDGKNAWLVHVGKGLSWNLTMSADGTQILDKKQLFMT